MQIEKLGGRSQQYAQTLARMRDLIEVLKTTSQETQVMSIHGHSLQSPSAVCCLAASPSRPAGLGISCWFDAW
jgi:hypothetical protein